MLSNMALMSSTSYNDALILKLSEINDFFDSKSFSDHRAYEESKSKIQIAIVERLNLVIKVLGRAR